MAWEHFPTFKGQSLSAELLNELRYAMAERAIPLTAVGSFVVVATPQRGWGTATVRAWLVAVQNNIKMMLSGGSWAKITYESPTSFTLQYYTSNDAQAALYPDRLLSVFYEALGQHVSDWPKTPANCESLRDIVEDVFKVLDILRIRRSDCTAVTVAGRTPATPIAGYTTEPTYHWYRSQYGMRTGTTPEEQWNLAKASAALQLASSSFANGAVMHEYPGELFIWPMFSAYWYYSQPAPRTPYLWNAAAWIIYKQAFDQGTNLQVYGFQGLAQKSRAIYAKRMVVPASTDATQAPTVSVIEYFLPAWFTCYARTVVDPNGGTTYGGQVLNRIEAVVPLARSINVNVRKGPSSPSSLPLADDWGDEVDVVTLSGQHDGVNGLTRLYRFQESSPSWQAMYVDKGMDAATTIAAMGDMTYPGLKANYDSYSKFVANGIELVDCWFPGRGWPEYGLSYDAYWCKGNWVKCTWS